MNSFIRSLPGSYAYLLVFQIVIVTVLLLFLLWLIARRLREVPAPEPAGVAVPDESMIRLSREQATKIEALENQVAELDKGGATLVQAAEKNKALEDKVRYLEQKLLEYEILQEEISSLSLLKVENEKLKAQVLSLGGSPVPSRAAAPAPGAPAPEKQSPLSVSLDPPGLKPFEDTPAEKAANLGQDDIDGLIAKIDNLSTKK